MFREGRTKAVGNVTKVIYHSPSAGGAHMGQGGSKAAKMARNEQRNRGGSSNSQANAASASSTGGAASGVGGTKPKEIAARS